MPALNVTAESFVRFGYRGPNMLVVLRVAGFLPSSIEFMGVRLSFHQ